MSIQLSLQGGYTCNCGTWVPTGTHHLCNCYITQWPVYVPYPVYPTIAVQPVVPMKTATEDIRDALKALEAALDKLADEKQVRQEIKDAFKRVAEKLGK